jgi:TolB protein
MLRRAFLLSLSLCLALIITSLAVGRLAFRGTTLAFASTRAGDSDIYLMDIARGWLHNLTRSPGYDGEPAFSPDGSRIAFTSRRAGSADIFVMTLDGGELRNVTGHPASESLPVWSSDGGWLGFVSDWGGVLHTYVIWLDADGGVGGWRTLPSTRAYFELFGVSPDGSKTVFVMPDDGRLHLYLADFAGNTSRLTRTAGSSYNPIWSPDSRSVIYESNASGGTDIYRVAVDGGAPVNLTAHPAVDYLPAWSPDGGRIAFVSNRDGGTDIYLVSVDGTSLQRLTQDSGHNLTPIWLP